VVAAVSSQLVILAAALLLGAAWLRRRADLTRE
jgi:MYXO-CTERM domain-containing protein